MPITGTDRGTGLNNASSSSFICTPTSTIPVNSAGVLFVAVDNTGAGGAAGNLPASVTDSVGNIWTRQLNPTYDPGAASAGVETAWYVCQSLTTALTSANNVTLTLGNAATAKVYAFHEITPSDNSKKISYVTGAAGTGAASGTPSVPTSSITSGDIVIGGGGSESSDTWVGDADTTNGTWSVHQHVAAGTGTSGMSLTTQRKIVTATATQTYNPTLTSADQILSWIRLTEIPRLNYVNLESMTRGMNRGMGPL